MRTYNGMAGSDQTGGEFTAGYDASEPHRKRRVRHAYGPHSEQYVDLWTGERSRGLAILIHGGYWRAAFTADLMRSLVADLIHRGWDVANVEYRRVGAGGGYPTTLEDAAVAVRCARESYSGDAARTVLVGHSVGGQLALLNARHADSVLALAPVTDVRRTFDEDLGDHAAIEFMAATPEQKPDWYTAASPRWQLPVDRPVLITHGVDDARVPIEHSRDYRAAAAEYGDRVELHEYASLSHRDQINPSAAHWSHAADWLAA